MTHTISADTAGYLVSLYIAAKTGKGSEEAFSAACHVLSYQGFGYWLGVGDVVESAVRNHPFPANDQAPDGVIRLTPAELAWWPAVTEEVQRRVSALVSTS